MYVRAGRPAFARPCVGIHKSTSLMSSSLQNDGLQNRSKRVRIPVALLRLLPDMQDIAGEAEMNLFEIERFIFIKMDLAFNNQQKLICQKTTKNK